MRDGGREGERKEGGREGVKEGGRKKGGRKGEGGRKEGDSEREGGGHLLYSLFQCLWGEGCLACPQQEISAV